MSRRLSTVHFFGFISLLICLTSSLEDFILLFIKIITSRVKRKYKFQSIQKQNSVQRETDIRTSKSSIFNEIDIFLKLLLV